MAYLKPPWFVVHVFNPIARLTGIGGSQTLTVTRSSNHLPQRIPVVVPTVDGVKYLVSTRGESAWVKNVRENPVVALGLSNGQALVFRHTYKVSYPDGKKTITPAIEYPYGNTPIAVPRKVAGMPSTASAPNQVANTVAVTTGSGK